MKHIFQKLTSKLPQWLRDDLIKLAIGGAIVALIFFVVWIVMLFKRYAAIIATAVAIIGFAYILGEIVMSVKRRRS
jgi:hypothetical protein